MIFKIKNKAQKLQIGQRIYIAMSACLLVFSCQKKELTELDILSAEMSGALAYYIQAASSVTFNGSSVSNTNYTGIPVRLAENASTEEIIDAFVDVSLVASYNELYDENNLTLPEGAFVPSGDGTFSIAANSLESPDSLYAELADPSQLETNMTYLVPIRLSARSGARLAYSVVFLKVGVTITDLRAKMTTGTTRFNNIASYYFGTGIPFLNYSGIANNASGLWGGPSQVSFAVGLNYRFSEDVQVEVVADTTDVSYTSYAAYRSYQIFPTSMYEIIKNTATIPANSTTSSDSITVRLRNDFTPVNFYMLTLRVTANPSSREYVPAVSNDSAKAYITLRRFTPATQ